MSELSGKRQAGTFRVDGRDIFGELTVDGSDTLLRLRDEEFFDPRMIADVCIQGTLHDLVKVSLLGCISSDTGHASRKDRGYDFADIFPHYVLSGDRHLSPADRTISLIYFVIHDATSLFYDFHAFGMVADPALYIEAVANANQRHHHRTVETGPDPEIAYFTKKREIFSVDTTLGTVSAAHNPVSSFGGPRGLAITNTIPVHIKFAAPVDFETAFDGMLVLVRYFELLLGRQQDIFDIGLVLEDGSSPEHYLNVDWSMAPRREVRNTERSHHPADILIGAVDNPQIFGSVLSAWLEREGDWKTSRARFARKFGPQRSYDLDRLIATANMFDILPDSIFPAMPPLPGNVERARIFSNEAFGVLPKSSDRDFMLGALGRLGKLSLERKIASRVKLITDQADAQFSELAWVTQKAMNCRNYFVGGGSMEFDYTHHSSVTRFFVDAFEFVFGASDLIQAGWDINTWLSKGTTMSHPFGAFKIDYGDNLRRLKHALAGQASPPSRPDRTFCAMPDGGDELPIELDLLP